MRDNLTLDPTPSGEECAQIGSDNYMARAQKECDAYLHQLERTFPVMPEDTYFAVKRNPHEFGTYLEVVVFFETEDEASSNFAFAVDGDKPTHWDEEAKKELASKEATNG